MKSMLITCPESAHLERIDYEDHPLGILIATCSRFTPACAVTCQRACAAMMDRRGRLARAGDAGEDDAAEDDAAEDDAAEDETRFEGLDALLRRWQS